MLTLNDFLNKKYAKKYSFIKQTLVKPKPKQSPLAVKSAPRILHQIRSKIENKRSNESYGFYGLTADIKHKVYLFHRNTDLTLRYKRTYPTHAIESKGEFLELLIESIQIWGITQRGFPYMDATSNMCRSSKWFKNKQCSKIRQDLLHYYPGLTRYYVENFVSIDDSITKFLEYGRKIGVFQDSAKLIQCPRCGILGFKECRFCEVI